LVSFWKPKIVSFFYVGVQSLANIDSKLGSALAVNVGNFPSTQNVSASSLPLPTGAATSSNQATTNTNLGAQGDSAATNDTGSWSLIALFKRLLQSITNLLNNSPLGQADPIASRPVVICNEQQINGSSLSAVNTNLLTGNVNDWYDARGFNSACIQIIGSAGIASGQIIFEQTNDNVNAVAGRPLPAYEVDVQNANPIIAAFNIAANSIRMFNVAVNARYIRVRISTVFAGGTVQAVGVLSQLPFAYPTVNIQQATAANLNANVSGTVTVNSLPAGTNAIGDVGTQYRANATGAASKYHLIAAASVNNTNLKATAGRLLGWQLANTTASWLYVKLHNQSTAPTAGASVFMTIAIPPNGVNCLHFEGGIAFSTGIGITTVTGAADSDTTAVTANSIVGTLVYM
ncbi:MAG TPA: hypothetical protein PLM36_25285, partial [Leptospiraceae bacterium]|nr:hypothetical protein [Leptospiraceae bacterium]